MITLLTILSAIFIVIPAVTLAIYTLVDAWRYIHDPENWDKP